MPINVDEIVRRNLVRIMEKHGLKQVHLASILRTTPQYLSAILRGERSMGTDLQSRLCDALRIRPAELYLEDTTPIIADERDQEGLNLMREADIWGVAEQVEQYARFSIAEAQQRTGGTRPEKPSGSTAAPAGPRPVPIDFTKEEREALRLYEKVEQLGAAHLLDAYAKELIAEAKKGKPAKQKKREAQRSHVK